MQVAVQPSLLSCKEARTARISTSDGEPSGESQFIGVVGMSEKLGIGDTFPKVTINLVDGRTLYLPNGLDAKYRIFLFYRGHW